MRKLTISRKILSKNTFGKKFHQKYLDMKKRIIMIWRNFFWGHSNGGGQGCESELEAWEVAISGDRTFPDVFINLYYSRFFIFTREKTLMELKARERIQHDFFTFSSPKVKAALFQKIYESTNIWPLNSVRERKTS